MSNRISVENNSQAEEYDLVPDLCPQCHHAVHPSVLKATLNGDPTRVGTLLEIAFKCTNQKCLSMFIGQYAKKQIHLGVPVGAFYFKQSVPKNFLAPEIFPEVVEISASFKTIYEQACAAEEFGLNEIAGVGYRKALEFLIKDYCIHKKPEIEESIKSSLLGAVINNHVEEGNLKACALRAAWLGNDETHYIRKWENKDINDLKILINLSCVWVRSNVLTEKYLAEMDKS
ncbi:MAG: hypothetical protein U1D41_10125 [Nitrosomonas sp.]|uniref:hypothetical protein n=1 Tax=Nitrosomonas sp. TaxID=42353 RepID=UPI0027327924|nr:hypothetical protein [Nitrosomonas sp.]MDP3662066.1 hypothetical protein [Nitrosomonas sp.]MDZ4106495.1 hypothetical protein [Nitrosomonas sp.]